MAEILIRIALGLAILMALLPLMFAVQRLEAALRRKNAERAKKTEGMSRCRPSP